MIPADVDSQDVISIPVSCASYDYFPLNPESALRSNESIHRGSNKKNAIITGDSHANELTTIQQLVLKGIIALEKEADWEVLSRLSQSTVLDQLRVADNVLKKIKQRQAEYLQKKRDGQEVLDEFLNKEIKNSVDEALIIDTQMILAEVDEDILYLSDLSAQQVQLISRLCMEACAEKRSFKSIIDNMRVLESTWHGDLGDGVCDRHNNDWKRLYFNKIFRQKGGKNFIMESNHGVELHMAFLLQRWHVNDPLFLLGREGISVADLPEARSLTGLRTSIAHAINTVEEINELMAYWLEALHLMTYSYSEGSRDLLIKPRVTLYSHALIGLETVFDISEAYDLPSYEDTTAEKLCDTIDAIDASFRESLIKNIETLNNFYRIVSFLVSKYLSKYFNPEHKVELEMFLDDIHQETFEERMKDLSNLISIVQKLLLALEHQPNYSLEKDKQIIEGIQGHFLYHFLEEISDLNDENNAYNLQMIEEKAQLLHIIWNRCGENISRSQECHDFLCHFAHGHQSLGLGLKNVHELDNIFGRATLPQRISYSLECCQLLNLRFIGESDTQFFIGYQFSSENGCCIINDGAISTLQALPKHYFTGIIRVRKTSMLTLEQLKEKEMLTRIFLIPKIQKTIHDEMDIQTQSVILHNANAVNMSYLEVKNEVFSPLLLDKIMLLKDENDDSKKETPSVKLPPIKTQFSGASLKAATGTHASMFQLPKKSQSDRTPHRRETLLWNENGNDGRERSKSCGHLG